MGLKITKSIKLGKFLRITKNKKSTSVSIGGKDVKITANSNKKITASLPGTGISYDTTIGGRKKEK